MSVLLCTDLPDDERRRWREALTAALPEARWIEDAQAAPADDPIDVAVVAKPPPGALAQLPSLRLVQSLWAGVERLLADPTLPPQLTIARMVDPAMTAAMVETATWAVLALHRDFPRYAAQQRAARWQVHPQRRADEVQVAVLGHGELGRAAAARLAGFGYRVQAWRRGGGTTDGTSPATGVELRQGPAALEAVLAAADIVVNLLPLTPDTRGLFDARRLAALRRGAALVNLARGAHVVEADLLAALDRGQLSHAVLDVFDVEPLPPAHPLWRHPAVTVLPHVAAQTDERSASQVVARQLRAFWRGEPVQHRVDRGRGY